MTLGIIGAGSIGKAIALRALRHGIPVTLANRHPERLTEFLSPYADLGRAGSREDALAADLVAIAVKWEAFPEALAGLDWSGRTVIDCMNPVVGPDFQFADLGGRTSSEIVADHLPGAKVIKSFNTLIPTRIIEDAPAGGRRVMFYATDHAEAATAISALLDRMGMEGIYLGPLAVGGALQQFPGGTLAGQDLVSFPMPR